tara:strand:- start:584 stop:1822 length:1239 start_codon:yes stop_codon:yes gene_type:complete
MSDKISKTRRIANAVNPNGSGGKFFLSTDSDAVLYGNNNNTSIKFGALSVGQQVAGSSEFYRTTRGVLENIPAATNELYNRFTSTPIPPFVESHEETPEYLAQLNSTGFKDAILGTDSDTTTYFNGTYFFNGDDSAFPTNNSYTKINLHRKFPLDSDSIFANGTNLTNDFLVKKKIGRWTDRGNVIFGRKQGGQTINIARVSGETTPIQFGYPRGGFGGSNPGLRHDSEMTVFTSFGTLDLQGRVIFKATDVTFGFLGGDSDSDSGKIFEAQSDGSFDYQARTTMSSQGGEQAVNQFIQPKQVVGKSYVRFLNSTSSPLTGSGTFRVAPLYDDSDGDGTFGSSSRRTNMTVTGNIADSDGTLSIQGGEGFTSFDSDGFTIGSTKVSIPSKYNLTIINAAGSTVATIQFLDPS